MHSVSSCDISDSRGPERLSNRHFAASRTRAREQ